MRAPALVLFPFALALTVAALAGCVTNPDEPSEAVPRLGWCPSWIQAGPSVPGKVASEGGNVSQTIIPTGANATVRTGAGWTAGGHPLDLYRVTVGNVTGHLELRAYAPGNATEPERGLFIRDYRVKDGAGSSLVAFLSVDGTLAHHEVDILLSSVAHADAAHPGPLRLEWRTAGPGAADYTVGTFYRVCGVPA